MATDAAPTTNGVYNGYQAQDTASVTSGAGQSTTASQSGAGQATGAKPDALEIGWYFVEQYYTTLSKNPERIHLFYSKKSQLITGKEAEKVLPSVGQKAISEKIKDLQLQDCKVRVLNVDSQAAFQNIVVQVIGEISNNSNPHEKFVQTFVLAEQPNGYFVLNDIFRYLDMGEEDSVEGDSSEEAVKGQAATVPEAHIESKSSGVSVADKAGAEVLDAKLEEVAQDEAKAVPLVEAETNEAVEEEAEEPLEIATKPASIAALEPEKPAEPEPSRAQSPHKEPASTPAVEVPPMKKTWASMVGAKATASSAGPAQPASSQPSAPKAAPTQSSATAPAAPAAGETATSPAPNQGNGWQTADHSKKQNRTQPKSDQTISAYVKGVTEKVDARLLRETLATFGELKYFDVSRPKNCAFVEFATSEGYNAAAAANPHVINGENILVEERRPRANQFGGSNAGTYGRGGANAGRGGRGGNQGRPGSQSGGFIKEAGRGNLQGRTGSKGGNVTPKGRGQAQAA